MPLRKPSALGERLRTARKEAGLTLRDIEKRSGVNSGYLSQLERGEIANPGPSVLQKIAKGYEEPFPVLMQWAGYIEEDPNALSLNAKRALNVLGDDFTEQELAALKAVLDVMRGRGNATIAPLHRTDLALDGDDRDAIRAQAVAVLRESGNLGTEPVDFDSVMTVAQLVKVGSIELTLEEKRSLRRFFGPLVEWALNQLQGLVHLDSGEVFVNPDMHEMRKRFVLGHEAGHAVLPDHRMVFAHLDDKTRLTPDFNDLLERQANQFSIELLAKGDQLRAEFDDGPATGERLDELHARFGISLQATARRIGEESQRPVAVAIAHKAFAGQGHLMSARVFSSPTFERRMRWHATAPPQQWIDDAARLVRSGVEVAPLRTTDIRGRNVTIVVDGLDTRYATIIIFHAQVQRRILRSVTPSRR